jgi:hypothetical protein
MLADQLERAREIIAEAHAHPPADPGSDAVLSEEFERIRWFPLPSEGFEQLRSRLTA